MIKIIIGVIALILAILTAFACYIFSKDKEKLFPRIFSWNWPVILLIYASSVCMAYLISFLF